MRITYQILAIQDPRLLLQPGIIYTLYGCRFTNPTCFYLGLCLICHRIYTYNNDKCCIDKFSKYLRTLVVFYSRGNELSSPPRIARMTGKYYKYPLYPP